jgi:hypothetical protein
MVSSMKKRSHSDSDDDVIPVDSPSPLIVRPPVKKLPNSKPDFHSFAPEDRKLVAFDHQLIIFSNRNN